MLDPQALLALAEHVAIEARKLGIETSLIGAAAMAVHGRERGTKDIDLASYVNPYEKLRDLEKELTADDVRTRLIYPDDIDPLGGVLRVWRPEFEDEDGDPESYVEVVNFLNPHRAQRTPAREAIERSFATDPDGPLRAVSLPDLVALKLYSSGRQDLADIVELLVQNDESMLEDIRRVASPFDANNILEQLIAEAQSRR